jgi:NADH-quinone oxidoreductase subunit C
LSSPDDTRPEGPPPGDVAPIESEPVGAEIPQPPAAADDPHPEETKSDTQGTGVDSPVPQVDEAPQAEHPVDDTASTAPTAATPDQPAAEVATPEPQEVPPPAHDELRTPVLEALQAKLGDAVLATELAAGRDSWARIRVDAWGEAARVLRQELGFTYFCFLSVIDWLPSPYGTSQDDTAPATVDPNAPLDHGVTGGATRFQLLARVEKPGTGLGITLKADVPDDNPVAPTWSHIYFGANWHEREAWEMFGVQFAGHPHLVHLYLPGEFEGFPLRKDFPLISRMVKPWPGLVDVEPMPGESEDEEEETADA